MNGVLYLDDYQNAVLAELKKIPWAVTVGIYPELTADFQTPAIFFDVSQWSRAEQENGGNVTLELTNMLYIVRHFESAQDVDENEIGSTETRVRNAALKISDWIHGKQFGPGTAPAVFENAEPMFWQKGEDVRPNHAIWGVSFTQRLAVGLDPFAEPDAPLLKEFWMGIFPEVGVAHKDDYVLVAKAEDN
ncbi:hypothetical protein D8682_25305 [Buttiauxella sp. 3AFRM03]|uniref:hypothetical protein n=1 Tax=Buttiauxella sp. 3AFRM03 TaxID=2479367 RepID=UPI000EF7B411|nr:hypothetical protein [Buttiauxella sp. 3AFRM03]AYN30003.1 hypothetical protein D8682_25305 [Buttiauxella sp. 3AFRM03]